MKKLQNGRSMVEMLGVLAIIGVLSVGAIAGYQKAMFKHKINKTIQEISTISQNIRTLCFGHDNKCKEFLCFAGNTALKSGCSLLKNLKLVPDRWNEKNNTLTSVFGTNMEIAFSSNYMFIEYRSIPKNVCMELANVNWLTEASGVGFITLQGNKSITAYSKEHAEKNNIALTKENSLPLPIDVISEACANSNNNWFRISFYP